MGRDRAPRAVTRLLRAPVRGLHQGAMRLEGELAHYLTRVLRLEHGATLEVFDPEAKLEARAKLSLDGASVTLRRGERTVTLPATCSEELRFATPRDYLLELAAAAGR